MKVDVADALSEYSEVTGITERTQVFNIRFDEPDLKIEELIVRVIADATERLITGDTFEIRSLPFPPEVEDVVDFGRRTEPREYFVAKWGVCWYWAARIQNKGLMARVHHTCGRPDEMMGYNLIARLIA